LHNAPGLDIGLKPIPSTNAEPAAKKTWTNDLPFGANLSL
jgi:hypothetical protein